MIYDIVFQHASFLCTPGQTAGSHKPGWYVAAFEPVLSHMGLGGMLAFRT